MISLSIDGKPIEVSWLRFSDGALRVKVLETELPKERAEYNYTVNLREANFNEVPLAIHLLQDALVNLGLQVWGSKHILHCAYLPYARADRRFAEDESFGFAAWVSILEGTTYIDQVVCLDMHNEALINKWETTMKLINKPLASVVRSILPYDFVRPDIIIAPDKGAVGRAQEVATALAVKEIIFATKKRDPNNGRIIATELPDINLQNYKVLIVDDICDGGGTFIPLAELLKEKGASEVSLLVSHGIFSRELESLGPAIDNIYCANIIGKYVSRQDLINFNS